MTVALIPVKRLEESKSRLLPQLPDERRQALTLAMLEDLIESLGRPRESIRLRLRPRIPSLRSARAGPARKS